MTAEEHRIAIVGKVLIDEVVTHQQTGLSEDATHTKVSVERSVGGGGPQAAFGAAVVHSLPPVLVAVTGNDFLEAESESLLDQLKAVGADLSRMQFCPMRTPTFRIVIEDEIPHHEEGPGFENWDTILEVELNVPDDYQTFSVLHVLLERSGYADLRLVRQWRARDENLFISMEPIILRGSPQEEYDSVRLLFCEFDLVSPDWHTACRVARLPEESAPPTSVMTVWATLGSPVVAIRRGAVGSYVWSRETQQTLYVPSFPVAVVDVTGAGNAYAAAFSVAYGSLKLSLKEAAAYASAVGAAAVMAKGLPPITDGLASVISVMRGDILDRVRPLT
mmetsp:Transcript_12985/g.39964  ORF Transcript_12985/g.39964 Transcript_12985/m.39964 type:complete len:334 (-) Transcript_12985:41-1042(-)